jgi:hypothetical protein
MQPVWQVEHFIWHTLKTAADEAENLYAQWRAMTPDPHHPELAKNSEKQWEQKLSEKRESTVSVLLDFDKKEMYNICGDRALHMCVLIAYTYPEISESDLEPGSLMSGRNFLIEVAKTLIQKWPEETQDHKNPSAALKSSDIHAKRYVAHHVLFM